MSLSEACDELLKSEFLDHEFGLPLLEDPTTQSEPETSEYYKANGQLTEQLTKLVYLDKLKELRELDEEALEERYRAIGGGGGNFGEPVNSGNSDISGNSEEALLIWNFRDKSLLNEYLTMALLVLRLIHHDGGLSPAKSEIAEELERMYNAETGSVHQLISEFERKQQLVKEHAELSAEIDHFLVSVLSPKLESCLELQQEWTALKNTYSNRMDAAGVAAAALGDRKLRAGVSLLGKRVSVISALCDLIPNLILCLPSDWHHDETLLRIMKDVQRIAEAVEPYTELGAGMPVEQAAKVDYNEMTKEMQRVLYTGQKK